MKQEIPLILIFAFLFLMLNIIPSSAQKEAEKDLGLQISAKVKHSEYKLNDKTGSVIFDIESELKNLSNSGIMEITYKLHFLDKSGKEMDTVVSVFNGQDKPLAPGKDIIHERSGQFRADRKPDKVNIEILEVKTEEEMPPIHVPQKGEYLYQVLNDPHLENIMKEPPVSVRLWIDRGGDRDEGILDTPEEIAIFVDAFTKIKISEEVDYWVTDNYNGVSMEFSDGIYHWISLNLYNLEYNIYDIWHNYELEDDGPFWLIMHSCTHPVEYDYGGGS